MRRSLVMPRMRIPHSARRTLAMVSLACAFASVALATPERVNAQERVLSGTVLDAITLSPLETVEVTVENSQRNVVTDVRGRFALTIPAGDVRLTAKRLGYRAVTHSVQSGQTTVRFVLAEVAIDLDELVITGTAQEVAQRALGTSVGRIDPKKTLELAPVLQMQDLMNARIPGVVVQPMQGVVGTGAVIRVRGAGSMVLTNAPLLYVDGVRVDNSNQGGPSLRAGRQTSRINDIAPEDIESIEVLKGPAATTLYGTEASRGVVQIRTKQGAPGPMRLSMTVKQGTNWLMNPSGRFPTVYSVNATTRMLDSLDIYDVEVAAGRPIFRTGRPQSYNLGIRGGTDAVRYYVSGDYERNEGVVSYNWQNRLSGRTNLQLVPNERLRISTDVGYTHSNTRFSQAAVQADIFASLAFATPATRNQPIRGFFRATPESVATIVSTAELHRVIGNVNVQHQPVPWLTQKLVLGGDVGDESNALLFPRDPAGLDGPFAGFSLGDKTVDRRRVVYSTLDYSANATAILSPRMVGISSIGAQHYSRQTTLSTLRGQGFAVPGATSIAAAAITTASEDRLENVSIGMFLQQQVGWNNRLFLTAGARADDNSAFGENFNIVVYPKLSASWVINEEPWWKVPGINTLKLRAAWGLAGQQPDEFAALRSLQPITASGDMPGLTPQNMGNPDLKPEKTEEIEAGFEAAALRDRVALSLTWYRQRTHDALVPRLPPPSDGFGSSAQLVNVGAIANWGAELGLDAKLIERTSFIASLGVTLSTNSNKVESLGGFAPMPLNQATGLATPVGGGQWLREGYPVGGFWAVKLVSATLDSAGRLAEALCQGEAAPVPCAQAPLVYLGSPLPRWEGSVRLTFTVLRQLRLNVLADFKADQFARVAVINNWFVTSRNAKAINEYKDPMVIAYDQLRNLPNFQQFGDEKTGFAKLREVSATFTLPSGWVQTVGGSNATFTVSGRNLAILWRQSGDTFGVRQPDPEVKYPNDLTTFHLANMPQYAQFMTALRVNF